MEQICFLPCSIDELVEKIRESLIQNPPVQNTPQEPKLISRQEAATLLKISLPTLNTWTKEGVIQGYKKGSRVYYKEDELISSLEEISRHKFKQKTALSASK